MKKLVVLALILMNAIQVFAQGEDVIRPNGRKVGGGGNGDDIPARRSESEATWIIGPELGANFNFFSSTIEGTFEKSPYNVGQSGSGVSPFVGAYVEYAMTRKFGVGARLMFDMKSFGNSIDAEADCPDVNTGTIPLTTMKSTYTESVNYVTINPLIRWSPIEQLVVHFGPVVQFRAGTASNTFSLELPEDGTCRFNFGTSDSATISTVESTNDTLTSVRFGLDIGVGYKIPIAPSISLVPRIGYQLMFTPYIDEEIFGVDDSRSRTLGDRSISQSDFTLTSLQVSLGLWFTL